LTIDATRLRAPVAYERPPERDESFPHVYGPINLDAVVCVSNLEDWRS